VSAFRRELKYREGLEVVKQGGTLLVYRAVPSVIKTEDRQHIITMYLSRYPTIPPHGEHVPINMADPTSITSNYASLFDRCVEDAEKYATASDFSRLIVNALDDDRGAMRLDPNSSKLWFKTEDQAFMDRLQGICNESGMATVRFLPVADTTEARKTVADSFKDTIANHIAEITEATDAWDGTDPSKAVQYLRKFKEVKMKLASAGDFYAENVDKLNNIIDLATKEVQRRLAGPGLKPAAFFLFTNGDVDMNVQDKLQLAEVEINDALVERDVEVRLALLGLTTRSHVFLQGEPGLGKTQLCEFIGMLIGGSKFQVLMNKNTDPDELFGPVSCRELFDNDELVRKVDGFLPTANIAILDEIFNASPAINNSILRILNEGIYTCGKQTIECNLHLAIAASNRHPDPEDGLDALWDRFLLRRIVEPVVSPDGLERLTWGKLSYKPTVTVSVDELEEARASVEAIPFGDSAKQKFDEVLSELEEKGIRVSNRRRRKLPLLCRAAAYLNGHEAVENDDLDVLQHAVWSDPEDADKVLRVVAKVASPSDTAIKDLLKDASEAIKGHDMTVLSEASEASEKLQHIHGQLKALPEGSKRDSACERVKAMLKDVRNAALSNL
jgi:MoxR-like ATPase